MRTRIRRAAQLSFAALPRRLPRSGGRSRRVQLLHGVVQIKVVPNANGRKQLTHKRTAHLSAEVTFAPAGGQLSKRTISITWHG